MTSVLPPICVFCAGQNTVPYARLSAESIIRGCPERLKPFLVIRIYLTAMTADQMVEAADFIQGSFPKIVQIDRSFKMGPFFSRPANSRLRQRACQILTKVQLWSQKLGIPPWLSLKIIPKPPLDYLAAFYNQWISYVCHQKRHHGRVCIVDADLFMLDKNFCQMLEEPNSEQVFARGWIARNDDIAIYKGVNYLPAGSECVVINTEMFGNLNRQLLYNDPSILDFLKRELPGITFSRNMVDSFYYESWRAQLLGNTITYPFRDLKLCHIGGFSHTNIAYIREALNSGDLEKSQFWIRRFRANNTLQGLFKNLRWDSFLIEGGIKEKLDSQVAQILDDKVMRDLWETLPFSSDEELVEQLSRELTVI